jgi:hypothetical protein
VANAKFEGDDCVCKGGYEETASGCTKAAVSFTLKTASSNTLVLTFASPLDTDLTASAVHLEVEGVKDINFTLEQASQLEWRVVVNSGSKISKGAKVSLSLSLPGVSSTPSNAGESSVVALDSQTEPQTSEEVDASALSRIAKMMLVSSVSASIALGFVRGRMSSTWSLINTLQIIGYIPMMDLDLPLALSEFFKSVLNFSFLPSVFDVLVPGDGPSAVSSAQRVGIDTSLFIINAGELFTYSFALVCLWPLACLLTRLPEPKLAAYFREVSDSYCWGFFLRFFIESYLDLVFASVFQLGSLSEVEYSSSILVSVGLALITSAFCIAAPVILSVFVVKNQHRFKEDEENTAFRVMWGSLFDEFKNNRGVLSSCFYVVFFSRRLLYVGLLYWLESQPVAQSVLNMLHSIAVAIFIKKYAPFSEKYQNFNNFAAEAGVTLTFLLSSLNLINLSDDIRLALQWSAIGVVGTVVLINLAVSCLLTYENLRKTKDEWMQKQERAEL